MQIADLRIENFRGIRAGHIRFGPHTVFIGPNNCGKTTVIEALALLFGRDRMVRTLTEHDFFGGDPQPADRIRLVATIVGFDGDEPADHTDWFRDDRGVIKWWNPATGAVSATRDDPAWRLACQIGFSARFDRPSLEVETARFFHDDDAMADVFIDEVWTAVPARLIRDAMASSEHADVHVQIDARFNHSLGFGPREGDEIDRKLKEVRSEKTAVPGGPADWLRADL